MTKSVPTTSAFNPLGDKGQLPDMADVLSALMVVCAAEHAVDQVGGSREIARYMRNVSSVVCPATDPQQERRPSRKPAQSPKAS